jgi:hypothetical protein
MKPKKSVFSPAPPAPAPNSVSHDLIADRAKAIWRERGSPEGRDMEHWLQAEQQLDIRHGRGRVRGAMEQDGADLSPDPDNALKDRVDKEIDAMDVPPGRRSATSL